MINVEDPTVHQLRLLLTLAEELHFGRAAARLYLTQPALSQQIRSLEQRLGVELFTRTSRRVEVTPIGQELLPLVKSVVEATDDLRNAARHASLGRGGLRLGVSDCAAALASTRGVLASITALHPGLDLTVRVLDLVEQTTALADGQIDAAFVYLPVPDGLHVQPLTTEPRVVCVSSGDPLARRSVVRLADLAGRPMVGLTPEMPRRGRDFWAVDPRPDGSPVRYTSHRITRVESLLSAVSFDGALAFLPSVAAELYPRPDISYLPVPDVPPCTFAVAWPAANHDTPQIAVVKEACRQLRRQGLPPGTMRGPERPRAAVEGVR
ncbi:LysR family transcriptional regulator [Streptomyces sp. NPDC020742]|uniref:LysR family transcriptional regulator n=1 Tax=unclassified Streptomyces TaxID=2593676 RepID=UPI0033C9676E